MLLRVCRGAAAALLRPGLVAPCASYPLLRVPSLFSPTFPPRRRMSGPTSGAKGATPGAAPAPEPAGGFKVLQEGQVQILLRGNDVFYNKAQIVNRDLSIAVLRSFVEVRREEAQQGGGAAKPKKNAHLRGATTTPGALGAGSSGAAAAVEGVAEPLAGGAAEGPAQGDDRSGASMSPSEATVAGRANGMPAAPAAGAGSFKPLRILEGLAASGLRAMRYACEVEGVGEVVALDKDPVAVEACARNVQHNLSRLTDTGAQSTAPDGPGPSPAPAPGGAAAAGRGEEGARTGSAGAGGGAGTEGPGGEGAGEKGGAGEEWRARLRKVKPEEGDARLYMLQHENQFDAVDLDPYGTPSPFLDAAVQSVADGGLLLCTATDMAVLCGNNAEVCYSKYGAYPHKAKYCHEMALRILLACIESHANRYKRYIVPVLSVSVDFYIRVFVRIYTSAGVVKASPSKLAWVYQCCGCDSFHLQRVGRIVPGRDRRNKQAQKAAREAAQGGAAAGAAESEADGASGHSATPGVRRFEEHPRGIQLAPMHAQGHQPLSPAAAAAILAGGGQVRYLAGLGPSVGQRCADCGKQYAVGGPMWAEPLHDMRWVRERLLPEVQRNRESYPAYAKIHGLLTTVSEELEDMPLSVDVHGMSAVLKCTPPPGIQFRSAIVHAGHRVSSTHSNPLGLKTDAPMRLLWDIMRCWVKKHPVKPQPEGSSAHALLSTQPEHEANFERAPGAQSKAQQQRVPRFLPNPEECWGPKPRARRRVPAPGSNETEGQAGAEEGEQEGAPEDGVHGTGAEEDTPASKKARV